MYCGQIYAIFYSSNLNHFICVTLFEFETLYSTDVSLMYIRANASVSGACMYIRRSTNINAQIRNTSRLSS